MMHKKTKPTKKMMAGGMMKKGYAAGGAMPMKDGKPAFIGDGKGKMAAGGMAKKGYQAGGVMDEEEMMGRMGRGMAKAKMEEEMMGPWVHAKATMQKKAMQAGGIAKAIKKHEASSPVHKAGLKAGGATKKMMAGGGMTKKMMAGGGMTKKMQAGGGVTRGDGIIKKGRTQGKMI
jgi:hypothetical protein